MNNESFEKYNAGTHILGRVFSVITLVLLVGAPFMIGLFLGASIPSCRWQKASFL